MGKTHTTVDILAQEVCAIVSAPYTVLFKTLSCLLAKIDDDDIYVWTIVKECQISPLVSRMISSLGTDESTWPVLVKLIRNRKIRDEIFRQDVWVFKKLLSHTSDDDVFKACLAMCKHQFPVSLALPIEYFVFVSSVFENSREAPESLWIIQMCELCSAMPQFTLLGLEEQTLQKCIVLWNNSAKTADNATFVGFMLIAAIVYDRYGKETANLEHSTTTSPRQTQLDGWVTRCSSLFNGPKSTKIIKSLLLRALFFLSEKADMLLNEVLQSLDRTRQILIIMSRKTIHSAIEEQETAQIVMKLVHKSTQVAIPVTVRLCILGILQALDCGHQLLRAGELNSTFEQVFVFQLHPDIHQEAATKSWTIEVLKFNLDHYSLVQTVGEFYLYNLYDIGALVQSMIDLCKPNKSFTLETMCNLNLAITFSASVFATIMGGYNGNLARSMTTTHLPDWWDWDLNVIETPSACTYSSVCSHAALNLQRQLRTTISKIMIASACTSEAILPESSLNLLRSLIGNSSNTSTKRDCFSLKQTAKSEDPPQISYDSFLTPSPSTCSPTEKSLADSLSDITEWTTKAVQSYIDEVCRDLQQRCQTVEAPLQAERMKCEQLQEQILEVQSSLEITLADHRARRLSWQHDLELEQRESDRLREQQNKLEQEMQVVNKRADDSAARAIKADEHSFHLTEQCEGLQEELEHERSKVSSSKNECERLTQENQNLQIQLKEAREKEQRLMSVLRGGAAE